MPVSFTRASALQIIANEKMGFSFGEPERINEDSLSVILPILRKTSAKRQYITLPETNEKQVTIQDTGKIDEMAVTNHTKGNLFVRSGTIFKGDTQERASLRSAVVHPGEKLLVKVRCVHASKGIQRGAMVRHGGITLLDLDQQIYERDYKPRDQQAVWASVMKTSASLYAMSVESGFIVPQSQTGHSPSLGRMSDYVLGGAERGLHGFLQEQPGYPQQDDLHTASANFSKTFDELLRKVQLHPNQAGLGLITEKGCETIELFDLPCSWTALHEDAVKRLGPNLAGKDTANVFDYKPEKVKQAVYDVLMRGYDQKLIFEHRPSNGESAITVTALSAEKYTGEVVEIDGRVVHLMLMRLV